MASNQTAEQMRLSRAIIRLVSNLATAWYGMLTYRMIWRILPAADMPNGCPTACTDGSSTWICTEFMRTLSDPQLQTLMAHEISHCALAHVFRRQGRDMERWNIACDLRINPDLLAAGFQAIAGWLHDPQYADTTLSAERIYGMLPPCQNPQSQQGQQGQSGKGGQGKGSGSGQQGQGKALNGSQTGTGTGSAWNVGGMIDPKPAGTGTGKDGKGKDGKGGKGKGTSDPTGDNRDTGVDSTPPPMTERDWHTAALEAARTCQAGSLPGWLQAEIQASTEEPIDWRVITRRFVSSASTPYDYSYARPNRRQLGQGLYLPGVLKQGIRFAAIATDTSGSTSWMQSQFSTEVTALIGEIQPEKTLMLYGDTRVTHEHTYAAHEEFRYEYHGGGGTTFAQFFQRIEQEGERPDFLIILTDLYGSDNDQLVDPGYPVLWVVNQGCTVPVPFGERVEIPCLE